MYKEYRKFQFANSFCFSFVEIKIVTWDQGQPQKFNCSSALVKN